ncbi:MAG: restriction endonuclease, partial [Caldisericia bacterium]|nr:restriction endonuclease [Caldisericia bacterium]
PFKKWFGNLWLTIDFRTVSQAAIEKKGNLTSESFYYKEGITSVRSGSKGPSYRYLPPNCVFDNGGTSIFGANYGNELNVLAYLNSSLANYVIDCLNPTVNTQIFDIKRMPFVALSGIVEESFSELAKTNIEITRLLNSYSLIELEFEESPFCRFGKELNFKQRIRSFFNSENNLLTQVLINEAIINEKIFEVYELTEHDKAMVLAKEGESIGGLPVSPEARDAYLADTETTKEFPLDTIREFIEELPTKEFSAEEREVIENGFPTLYQSNNDLEEFCTRHQVNPINIWYWFKQSNVIPQQRMHTLAMEFLADMIREILMEDEDGIIPLVHNAGEKVLLDRIEEKFREKGFSSAQYSSFDTVLGRPIQEYLNKYFFAELSDHLNLFMYLPKTPFIWHLSSGSEQGFDCYIIIYKWSRDKLLRLRSVYIEHRERALVNRQSDLSDNESADAQNEKDRIFRQLKEIETFKAKIDELLAEGYNPILDDGVGKNIAPLQKKIMIPYEVLNEGQLKKYLHADW